ncbi:MAG: GNAT family N-acetyltransferase [Candidatus Cloacimonetes bacterium]|nr:GNAT family N-acetyltransferase [Candidatus Cloacimonadota bacterium]
MKEIKLIEYAPEWAAAVADMWNESSEGWNGEMFNKTAESVLEEEKNSSAMHVFLIVEGEKTLGYCNLMHDSREPDALYVGMLNVRPEMHGRKLGKQLVLRAVQSTCEHGYGVLYLHTWAGNTKAVPLYKKTGFFWLDKDRGTHLVNYMPEVLSNPLVKPFFDTIDWYADNARPIDVKPDGRKVDGFEIYTYSWEKDGRRLEMDYTRRGRGLCRIETDQWSVRLEADNRKLAFGRSYAARFTVCSKDGEPVNVRFEGMDDGPIRFDWRDEGAVSGEQVFTGRFHIEPIERHIPDSLKHPSITAKVVVNGQETTFRLGIAPRFPVGVHLQSPHDLHHSDQTIDGWLDLSNNSKEALSVRFDLPDTDEVRFEARSIDERLDSEEKRSLPTRFHLARPCHYSARPEVIVCYDDTGEEVRFPLPLHVVMQGWQGSFTGTTPHTHFMVQGPWSLHLGRLNNVNNLWIADARLPKANMCIYLMPPEIGMPFEEEFSQEESKDVKLFRDDQAVCMTITLRSPRWPQVPLRMHMRLLPGGLAERHVELCNESDKPVTLNVMDSLWLRSNTKVLPMPEGIIEKTVDVSEGEGLWDYTRLTEPWMWLEDDDTSRAVIWSKEEPLKQASWNCFFDYEPGELQPGESWRSRTVTFGLNAFRDWQGCRAYAMGRRMPEETVRAACELELVSPFVNDELHAHARLFNKEEVQGSWTLETEDGSLASVKAETGEPGEPVELRMRSARPLPSDRLRLRLEDTVWQAERTAAVFATRGEVTTGNDHREGLDTLWADNGTIRLEAAPGFLHGLFSLRNDGREWLDTSFPEHTARAWWKPWAGGLCIQPNGLSLQRLLEEKTSAKHVRVTDAAGNVWQGLRIDVDVKENETWKGLSWSQYFLLLPGAPVLQAVVRVRQSTGRFLPKLSFGFSAFINPCDGECRGEVSDGRGNRSLLRTGKRMIGSNAAGPVRFTRNDGCAMLHMPPLGVYGCEVFASGGILADFAGQKIDLADRAEATLASHWFVFTDNRFTREELRPLSQIKLMWDTEN